MSRRRSISTPLPRSVGPLAPERDRIFGSDLGHAFGPHHPDGVPGQQVLVLVHSFGEAVGEVACFVEESQWRRKSQAADAEVRGHHALAADHFEQAQHVFALAEAIEKHRQRADVHGVRAQPHQVRVDAGEFVQQDAHPLRFGRNLEPQQFFHRQHVAKIIGERAEIIDAVGKRHDLLVELGLAGLFDSGMQIPDVGHDAHDGLAIDLKNDAQHSVG